MEIHFIVGNRTSLVTGPRKEMSMEIDTASSRWLKPSIPLVLVPTFQLIWPSHIKSKLKSHGLQVLLVAKKQA